MTAIPEADVDLLSRCVADWCDEAIAGIRRIVTTTTPSVDECSRATGVMLAVQAIPRTFEGQAARFAAAVRLRKMALADVPADFRPHVERLVAG